jgi:hypothetical protein
MVVSASVSLKVYDEDKGDEYISKIKQLVKSYSSLSLSLFSLSLFRWSSFNLRFFFAQSSCSLLLFPLSGRVREHHKEHQKSKCVCAEIEVEWIHPKDTTFNKFLTFSPRLRRGVCVF